MNYSWQRQLILETVQKQKEHLTAAQIYQLARKSCPHLSLGTVYRNLNLLVDTGQLRRVGVPGEADRFDWELPSHQHLYCRRCKKVINLALPSRPVEEMIRQCPDIQAEGYNFIIVGLCPDCKRAEQAAQAEPAESPPPRTLTNLTFRPSEPAALRCGLSLFRSCGARPPPLAIGGKTW